MNIQIVACEPGILAHPAIQNWTQGVPAHMLTSYLLHLGTGLFDHNASDPKRSRDQP